MDHLELLRENPDLAKEFDVLFDFSLLDELTERDEAEGRCTFTLPGMAFARDGSGGEYHLLEDGSIGYYSSEGAAGRLAESMDDLFSLMVSCICWHDCCDAKQYVDKAVCGCQNPGGIWTEAAQHQLGRYGYGQLAAGG